MSYIHKALKKAQREKISQHQGYDGVLSAQRNTNRFSGKAVFLISTVAVIGMLAFTFYSWFDSKDKTDNIKIVAAKKEPLQHPVREQISKPPAVHKKPAKAPDNKRVTTPPVPNRENISKPTNVKQLYYRARSFQKSGQLNDAKHLYQKALKADPKYADALNNLGVIYIQEKKYKDAQTNFEQAIRVNPGDADPYYNLACVYALKGEIELGLAHLKKACALNRSAIKWAKTDTDLRNLRGLPEFDKIITD